MVDIVFFVREGPNPELMYSLRSLRNVAHGDVWIVGHKPEWVQNVGHLPVPTVKTRTHWEQVVVAFREACATSEIPDTFALWNDDFFALKPTTVPLWHKGPAGKTLKTHARSPATNWKTGFTATVALLESWGVDPIFDYEIHVPMMIDKRLMGEALARAGTSIPALQRRTLYGALNQVGGEEHRDVAIGSLKPVPTSDQVWVATNDQSFSKGAVGEHIRRLFPDPSPYEKERL